jgi:hypothetical protein
LNVEIVPAQCVRLLSNLTCQFEASFTKFGNGFEHGVKGEGEAAPGKDIDALPLAASRPLKKRENRRKINATR